MSYWIGALIAMLFLAFALVVVLFTDAVSTDLKMFRRSGNLPPRMLPVGMPLAMALGTLAAHGLFPA